MASGRYRWRTRVRRHVPWLLVNLGVAGKGKHDCGDHEWYKHDDVTVRCYHCEVENVPCPPRARTER